MHIFESPEEQTLIFVYSLSLLFASNFYIYT